ncbi:LysR family transcriptional regulator [Cupriavidus basilensis]
MHDADWDDLRYFLAVSRAGSLAGAARALQVNHSTVPAPAGQPGRGSWHKAVRPAPGRLCADRRGRGAGDTARAGG